MAAREQCLLELNRLRNLIKQKEESYLRDRMDFINSSSSPSSSSSSSSISAPKSKSRRRSRLNIMSNLSSDEAEASKSPVLGEKKEVESGSKKGSQRKTKVLAHAAKSSRGTSESQRAAAVDFIINLEIDPAVPLDPIYPLESMNGAANGSPAAPIHAGQQMDLNFLYSKVLELSDQLRENREQTQRIVAGAEELAKRYAAATAGDASNVTEESSQLMTARVADLTHKLADAEELNKVLLHEQRENGKLIGEYEQGLEKVVGMLRDFAHNKEMEKNNLAREYLKTLQAERDEHLKTRLDRDQANAHVLKLIGQMRHAYKLAVEESLPEIEIVAGLQNEVRSLRNLAGLPREAFEEETGYAILRDVKGGAGEEED